MLNFLKIRVVRAYSKAEINTCYFIQRKAERLICNRPARGRCADRPRNRMLPTDSQNRTCALRIFPPVARNGRNTPERSIAKFKWHLVIGHCYPPPDAIQRSRSYTAIFVTASLTEINCFAAIQSAAYISRVTSLW